MGWQASDADGPLERARSLACRRSWRALVTVAVASAALAAAAPAAGQQRPLRTGDISVPDGFRVDVAVKGLAAPTMVAFDDRGRMLIAESGYCPDPDRCPGGPGSPKVTRIEEDGRRTVLAEGAAFGADVPVTAVAFHEGDVYVVHGGAVSIAEGGRLRPVLRGLPGRGDHQANQLVFHRGKMHVAVGTVTNSGVVGPDNVVFGWLKKPDLRGLHDVPCRDITLAGKTFESPNPFQDDPDPLRQLGGSDTVSTSPYSAFGETKPAGTIVPGNAKCNGAVLRADPDGSGLEMFAWGFRNPYGLEVGPDDALYATDHGFDARGSRPIENAPDCLWRVEEDAWHGAPDYSCGTPVTDERFTPRGKPQPSFILRDHPGKPPAPLARFDPHAATNGFAFAPSKTWGARTDVFVALFGDMTPATGVVARPQGYKVVRVDTRTGRIEDFVTNRVAGRPSQNNAGGIEHPSDVTFGPDGAMYITDWGVARITVDGLVLQPASGVVWKVSPGLGSSGLPVASSRLIALAALLVLGAAIFVAARGSARTLGFGAGAGLGALAGLALAAFAMFVAAPALNLPWYAPARLMATIVMGGNAVSNILEFDPLTFILGAVVVLAIGTVLGLLFAWLLRAPSSARTAIAGLLYGIAVWVLVQYIAFPVLFPLVIDKGFPPSWFAATFAIFGLALGLLAAWTTRRGTAEPSTG